MQDTKIRTLKILAGSVALILIGGILFVTNAFVGNPISARIADRTIKDYVRKNYSFLDLELEKSSYNFKDGSYAAKAWSKTSIDTKFHIYYRDGKVERDDYEDYVLGKYNTLRRLEDEYSFIAKRIIAKEMGFEDNTTMVMYHKENHENADDILELDMKFDKTLPIDAEVTLRLDLADNSLESIAKILTDAHKAFVKNGCIFSKYGLFAENDERLVMVNEVTPRDIESNELVSLLEKAKENEDGDGVMVFIKDKNK